jgi:glycosyltransferase involved in cell wall biosynthesis
MIKKRVLINGSMIDDRPSGVGIYALSIVKELLKSTNQNVEFTLITPRNSFVEHLNVRMIFISSKMKTSNKGKWSQVYRFLWNIFVYPFYLRNFDLGYSPTSHGALFSRKQIITIHDLIALHYPKQHRLQYYYFKLVFPIWLKYVKKVIAISYQTQSDILTFFNCNVNRIEVIQNGFDNTVKKKLNANKYVKDKFEWDNFILTIGAAYPHKNIETLIRAFHGLDQKMQNKYKLIICGSENHHTRFLNDLTEKFKLTNQIIFTGYISDVDLNYLYSAADLFVFPSLFEGFGFPPLEAMNCDCPVIVSDIPIFHEIYDDAVIYFDGRDQVDLSKKISETLSIEDNSELIEKGSERVKLYSWEKCGTEILSQIRNC